jgi:hypothetical protein
VRLAVIASSLLFTIACDLDALSPTHFPRTTAHASAGRCVTVGLDHGPPTKLNQVSVKLTIENGCEAATHVDVTRMRVLTRGAGGVQEVAIVAPSKLEPLEVAGYEFVVLTVTYAPIDASTEVVCVKGGGSDLSDADHTGGTPGCLVIDRDRAWLTEDGTLMTKRR